MLTFIEMTNEQMEELVSFLTSQIWPFHGQPKPAAESVRASFQKGFYTEDGNRTFWIMENSEKIGIIRVFDLEDPTCLFDIRFKESHRGKGLGVQAVKWISDYLFRHYQDIMRVEAHTRSDNLAMRKTLNRAGYLKEAYHRKAWPQGDKWFDSVGYGLIRSDWENQTVTVINDPVAY